MLGIESLKFIFFDTHNRSKESLTMKIRALFYIAIAAVIGGCASVTPLSNSAMSFAGPNLGNSSTPVLYESEQRGKMTVAYNLDHYKQGQIVGGYRLTLLFKNSDSEATTVTPEVWLMDANGVVVNPTSYENFVADTSALTGTSLPKSTSSKDAVRYSGTVFNNSTGQAYNVSGTARSRVNPGTSFAQGGDAILAAAKQKAGKELQTWGVANWLLTKYEVPPGAQVVGTVFFPALNPRPHPMTLRVKLGNELFEFKTGGGDK